jgi:biopolymer transport protein ExbD
MAFSTQDPDDSEVMSEINMIPLIDVMLVLLIVFMITVPVMKHAVTVDLPQAATAAATEKPETVKLSVQADGSYHWNQQPITDDALRERLTALGSTSPMAELHIRGDKAVRYERVAQAMAMAQQAGVRKIGFVTEP